jgi:hypothetical protein
MFVTLTGLNSQATTELYNSFASANLKMNAIKLLAISSLATEDSKIILALLRVIDSHQKIRDKIAHWAWGIPTEIPDGLVLVDPKFLASQQANLKTIGLEHGTPRYEDIRILACTRFRRHRVRCFNGTGGGSWRGGSLHASSSLRLCG